MPAGASASASEIREDGRLRDPEMRRFSRWCFIIAHAVGLVWSVMELAIVATVFWELSIGAQIFAGILGALAAAVLVLMFVAWVRNVGCCACKPHGLPEWDNRTICRRRARDFYSVSTVPDLNSPDTDERLCTEKTCPCVNPCLTDEEAEAEFHPDVECNGEKVCKCVICFLAWLALVVIGSMITFFMIPESWNNPEGVVMFPAVFLLFILYLIAIVTIMMVPVIWCWYLWRLRCRRRCVRSGSGHTRLVGPPAAGASATPPSSD